MKTNLKASALILAVLGLCMSAIAQDGIIDQHSETTGPFTFTPSPLGGLGQEFRPSLGSLDFVDLLFFNEAPTAGGLFTVSIREDTITGRLLGMSQPTMVGPLPTLGPTHFSFASSVALSPGATYVLELSGMAPGWGVRYGPGSSYTDGQAIVGGSPVNSDLWFREGVVAVPEPAVWSLCLMGAAALLLFRRIGGHAPDKQRRMPALRHDPNA